MSRAWALIVEDDIDLANIFAKAMELAGFETEVIFDGAEASEFLTESTPEIVMLDLHLPKVNGESLLHQIRGDERLHKTRVILASADLLLAAHLEDQVDMTLVKPISFDQLHKLAKRWFSLAG